MWKTRRIIHLHRLNGFDKKMSIGNFTMSQNVILIKRLKYSLLKKDLNEDLTVALYIFNNL